MIELNEKGLFCQAGGFHIDPSRRVELALITHAHSDHARAGSRKYICARSGAGLLRRRIGASADVQEVEYGQVLEIGKTKVSFHPAGHILGSAQIRVECDDRVWVVSGDYKRDDDPSCEAFETVQCDTYISEATFGNPKYKWDCPLGVVSDIFGWWEANRAVKRNSILFAYALGKTQRVLATLARHTDRPVYVFGEAADLTECYRREGIKMVPVRKLEDAGREGRRLEGELVVAPHGLRSSPLMHQLLRGAETAFASGWMKTGAFGMARSYDRGFALSDHADWDALVRTIQETGARQALIQHTSDTALPRHLRTLGMQAHLLERPNARRSSSAPAKGKAKAANSQLSLF